ncbi:hypothetical protein BKA67DRAFT_555451 [Truncatella angustata]|uniref:Heterokaryon incompatibility domain-containing protein n=1 Tax=Truncatella angustata TaxID=152316 RepID=A0A9P9A1T8_9PEZI|nr:uncharacterized protein BKA67DRAFT_555451 [Truncatella angustata]KAH6657501.1 hypothetical protein BKA67DRAFT_555451 [Truncatella angustata]
MPPVTGSKAKPGPPCPPYEYQSLRRRFIGLLVSEPGTNQDGIVIRLQPTRYFKSTRDSKIIQGTIMAYEALSYVWGSRENLQFVYVGQKRLSGISITRSLDIALRYIRKQDTPRVIDALCIN